MTKTTQYKNTPIGPIPTEWEVKKLGDICKKTGSNLTNADINEKDGIYNVYGASGLIKQVDFFQESTPYISIVKDGAGVGRVLICEANSSVLATMDKIHNNENVNLFYLSLLLNNIDFEKYITGSTIPHIYFKDYKIKNIPLPPLPEQQKIAEVLSTWDKAIQETDAIIKKLVDRNKALANKLFEENNWQINKLSDLFERITDKNKEGNTTVTTISAKHGFIRQEDFFNKTVASKDLSNYYLINKGDFCYNKSYSKDYDWGVVKRLNDFEKAVVTTLYICFRFKDNSQNSDFWELYFENKILDKGLSKVAQEGGRAHGLLNVTSGDFFSIKVKVPSLEEQNAIAEILNTANQEVKQYQQKLEALKLQKKGLMQQLLTGKVRTV
ncbi:restriction endonuclease subunit S [Empedobacter sp.]|uniref:restriction endonuclease subunit S n=1 Tax=Empedobacter sp. TaxID=1927715 RepID=UPI0028A17848|nr:restriction endonuclease subunit S [Empedobacter sp.]